ncbi:MAG TPA: transcriptional regulator [Devosia sp.]|jgi:predicted transcriptional regulator|nr:transcriptional regulator [Devosia sp.]
MAKAAKRVVTIGVSSIAEVNARFSRAWKGEVSQGHLLSFISVELMWKTLAPKRWEIIRAMTGQGPMSVREVARRVNRDVKAVHGDVRKLLLNGIVDKSEDGRVEFPYDEIRVAFSVGPDTAIAQPDLGEALRAVTRPAKARARAV